MIIYIANPYSVGYGVVPVVDFDQFRWPQLNDVFWSNINNENLDDFDPRLGGLVRLFADIFYKYSRKMTFWRGFW